MKTLIAVLIGSTMTLSFSAGAITCADLWEANPQSQSESFIQVSKTEPDVTDAVKQDSIKMCQSAAGAAKAGVGLDMVLNTVARSARGLPDVGKASMLFMASAGWQLGKGE